MIRKTFHQSVLHIIIQVGRHAMAFDINRIVRLEAKSNYTCIHFTDHRPLITAKVLAQFEDSLLPHGFIRPHRGHVINRQFVKSINMEGVYLLDQTTIPFSRRRKKEVMKLLED